METGAGNWLWKPAREKLATETTERTETQPGPLDSCSPFHPPVSLRVQIGWGGEQQHREVGRGSVRSVIL